MSENKVLLVGHPASCLRFIKHISGNEEMCAQEHEAGGALLALTGGWTLINKYYRAHLDIFTIDGSAHDVAAAEVLEGHSWSAMIFVFECTSPASQLQYWTPWLAVSSAAAPAVHMCVSVSDNSDNTLSEHRAELWDDWCIDNGIEFVKLALNSDDRSNTQQSQSLLADNDSDEEDEREGSQIIIDSLHANMWPEMKMIDRGDKTGVKPSAEVLDGGYVEFGEFQQAQEGQNIFEKTVFGLETMLAGGDETDFSEVLSNVSAMRDHVSTLPDEERRQMAAKFALYVANLMDDLGEQENT